jgi:myo-inositol-1(or 4)-monophosphatase
MNKDAGLEARISFGREAVLSQVGLFASNLGKVKSLWKADNSRVTKIDYAISENLRQQIHVLFPLDHYCSEESLDAEETIPLQNRFTWVVDPVDGTNNYATGVASCAISVGLFDGGEPAYGFLYDQSRSTLVEGGPGYGVLENEKKVNPLPPEPFGEKATIGMHFPIPSNRVGQLHPLLATAKLRSIGSGALNLLHAAMGRTDGALDFKVRIWDIAAGLALAKATNREYHFIGSSPLPLEEFSVNMPFSPYFCGTESFCEAIRGLLGLGKGG